MNRRSYKKYIVFISSIFLILCVPLAFSERVRGVTIATLASVWGLFSDSAISKSNSEIKIQKLQLENQMLKSHLQKLKSHLQQERFLDVALDEHKFSAENKRHQKAMQERLRMQFRAIPAQVIYRTPSSWNSSLWINVGKNDNRANEEIVAKNSPVVRGNCLIGVVDYVGDHQSRVRLLTDSGLNPSVRAARGDLSKCYLCSHLETVIEEIEQQEIINQSNSELLMHLEAIRDYIANEKGAGTWYLAKGELRGNSQPMWRSQGNLLKGIGFNYDFADEEGPARDLRTGIPTNDLKEKGISIIQNHDLLITTGMDGIFPEGLYVAEVTKVNLLREGDYYYELEAKPAAGNFQELSTVFVLPPSSYEGDF